MEQDEISYKIFQTLQSQSFHDWYIDGGNFDNWIRGELPIVPKKTVLEDIKNMFNL